jgi:uncharacterized membrane protein YfcA
MESPHDWPELALIAAVFLLAGLVKGVVGLGLPSVSLGLLTALIGLPEAMALMLVPSFVTNLWQALAGGALAAIWRRLWRLLLAVCLGVWLGAGLLARGDTALLAGLLGILLALYAIVGLAAPRIPAPGRREAWLSPLVGAVNGLLTGLTGSFVVPGVPYLQALGLPRDVLVQAMGVLFSVSTLALGLALGGHGRLGPGLGAVSAAATLPALLGMALGARLRRHLSERRFRQALFAALLLLGLYIALRAFVL